VNVTLAEDAGTTIVTSMVWARRNASAVCIAISRLCPAFALHLDLIITGFNLLKISGAIGKLWMCAPCRLGKHFVAHLSFCHPMGPIGLTKQDGLTMSWMNASGSACPIKVVNVF